MEYTSIYLHIVLATWSSTNYLQIFAATFYCTGGYTVANLQWVAHSEDVLERNEVIVDWEDTEHPANAQYGHNNEYVPQRRSVSDSQRRMSNTYKNIATHLDFS